MSDFDQQLLEIFETEERSDYFIKLHRIAIVPESHPSFNEGRVEIEIFGRTFHEDWKYNININGQQYKMNQRIFDRIKTYIDEHIREFMNWSFAQTEDFFRNNGYDGGMGSSIKVKSGQVTIYVNGQCRTYDKYVDDVIENIVKIITENQE